MNKLESLKEGQMVTIQVNGGKKLRSYTGEVANVEYCRAGNFVRIKQKNSYKVIKDYEIEKITIL